MSILVGDDDNGGVYAWVGVGDLWELSIPSSQFCCVSQTALNFKILKIFTVNAEVYNQ